MKSSVSSSSPDDVTTITATDAVPADNAEAPAKDYSQEEAAEGIAGADGLSGDLVTTDGEGGSSSRHHQRHSTNFNKFQSQEKRIKNKPDYTNQSNVIH